MEILGYQVNVKKEETNILKEEENSLTGDKEKNEFVYFILSINVGGKKFGKKYPVDKRIPVEDVLEYLKEDFQRSMEITFNYWCYGGIFVD